MKQVLLQEALDSRNSASNFGESADGSSEVKNRMQQVLLQEALDSRNSASNFGESADQDLSRCDHQYGENRQHSVVAALRFLSGVHMWNMFSRYGWIQGTSPLLQHYDSYLRKLCCL